MKQILSLFVFAGLLTACADKKVAKDKQNNTETTTIVKNEECPPDIMCTMDFRSVTLTVNDQNNQPVLLDSFRSVLVAKDSVLMDNQSEPQHMEYKNVYAVANDSHMRIVGKAGSEINVRAYKGGKEVVNHKMKIGHDCCHIAVVEGEKVISVNL